MCVRTRSWTLSETIAIVAGNAEEAKQCAKRHGFKRKDWFYVSSPQRVLGCTGLAVIRTGSYAKRKDIEAIDHALLLSEIATISKYKKLMAELDQSNVH